MKKIVLIAVTLLIAMSLFADDALVLPQNIFRLTTAFSHSNSTEKFDADGNTFDSGKTSGMSLSFALEYGVTNWITAALQWTPGYVFNTEIEKPLPETVPFDVTVNGYKDFFAGAKFQILGEKAPIKSEKFRFAFAAGALIPINFDYDPMEEIKKAGIGEDINIKEGTNALGLGGRVYADYVVNDMFFLNLYSEIIRYLPVDVEKDFKASSYNAENQAIIFDKVDYGYKLTAQIDPHMSYNVSDEIEVNFNVPLAYTQKSGKKWEGLAEKEFDTEWSLGINPCLGVNLWGLPVPMGFSVSYDMILAGENAYKDKIITIQCKPYFAF